VPAFRADPRCEIVAIAGSHPEKASAVARAVGIPQAYSDWRELVESPAVDAVAIATPPAVQPAIVVAAAARRKHVFCEKPLGGSLAGAREALAAVQAAAVVHGIDFLFPESACWKSARALLARGTIGTPLHFSYTWRVETYASRTNASTWKNRTDDGGGALGNFASHAFFNIEWLLGAVRALRAFSQPAGARRGRAVDGTVDLEGGMSGVVSISTDAYLGSGHVVEVYGSEGTLVLSNTGADYASDFTLRTAQRPATALAVVDGTASASEGDGRLSLVSQLTRRFVDAIEGASQMRPNLLDGVRVQTLLAQAAASIDGDVTRDVDSGVVS
jgi:predicted dehydrogenase